MTGGNGDLGAGLGWVGLGLGDHDACTKQGEKN